MSELINLVENSYNLQSVRQHFPILQQSVHNKPLVYLDNAATTQKPDEVLQTLQHYYQHDNANIHRGVHTLSMRATKAYENAREVVREFINAAHEHEIIFTKGTTEGINLIAAVMAKVHLKSGDNIILSTMEHHSNIVPWQLLRDQLGIHINVIPINDAGELNLDHFKNMFTANTKLVAITHVSNAIGTINPVDTVIDIAHRHNVPVLLDGAQAVPHMTIDVQALDCDFYVFSSHKMYGPTGVGVLYGKSKWLEQLPPYQGGGDMITEVSFEKVTFNKLPHKFEAGTPNIAGVIGLASAIRFMQKMNINEIQSHEEQLLLAATELLMGIPGLRIIGNASHKAAVISFVFDDIHPHDVGTFLDHEGIAIRAGHHCAMPLMNRFNVPATNRASFALYNTLDDVSALYEALVNLKRFFQ